MSTKLVVLGSNSFSGSDFIDLLLEKKNYKILGISRSPEKSSVFLPYKRHSDGDFQFYQLDLNKDMEEILSVLDSFQPDYIVNFAAQSEVAPSWFNPAQWFETNTVSLARLCDHLKDAAYLKRFVHISSPEVYGNCHGAVVQEEFPLNPSTPYAASKAAADLFLLTLVKQYHFPVCFIRSTNVYGAHQQLFKIIPRSVIYLKSNRRIQLHGGGGAVKSYIHIRDISRGEWAVMEQGRNGEIYHFSPERGISIRQLVQLICREMKRDFAASIQDVGERPGQDAVYEIDSSKARAEFGWQPAIELTQGIREVIDWVEENWEQIKEESLEYIHKP